MPFINFIGQKVEKKSGKPFKSGSKINTIKGIVEHQVMKCKAFIFQEDESEVECWRCYLVDHNDISLKSLYPKNKQNA